MKEIRNIIEQYDAVDHSNEKMALASVVNVEASSYRRIGARMLVQSSGIWIGGISGGCLEGDALRRSQKAIFDNKVTSVIYDTMEDDNNQIGVGLGCNGRIEVLLTPIDPSNSTNEIEILRGICDDTKANIMLKVVRHPSENMLGITSLLKPDEHQNEFAGVNLSQLQMDINLVKQKHKAKLFSYEKDTIHILIEFIRPETQLILVGDNYDIYSMLGIAKQLGWRSTLMGKTKKLSKEAYNLAYKVLALDDFDKIPVNEYTAILLMSHDYKIDLKLLKYFKNLNPAYLGILGPKTRFEKLQQDISKDISKLDFIHSPTGLEIGAESPEEIALSICSEIVAKMRGKSGGSLHHKKGSIHERDF